MRSSILVCVVCVLLPALADAAERYKVNVTRKDSDLYKVDGTSFWIRTKYCHEYAYGETAVMIWHGRGSYSNKLVFLDYEGAKKAECDIESLLAEAEPT